MCMSKDETLIQSSFLFGFATGSIAWGEVKMDAQVTNKANMLYQNTQSLTYKCRKGCKLISFYAMCLLFFQQGQQPKCMGYLNNHVCRPIHYSYLVTSVREVMFQVKNKCFLFQCCMCNVFFPVCLGSSQYVFKTISQ